MSYLPYLREILFQDLKFKKKKFPFDLPILSNLSKLVFTTPITIFTGENGAGKSTLLESMAVKMDLQCLGETSLEEDPTLIHARKLAETMRMRWNAKIHRGFFLRAEDYFAYLKKIEQERHDYSEELEEVKEEFKERSQFAQNQARMTLVGSLHDIHSKFGDNADGQSHGESFLNIFKQRIRWKGLFLIDEPEAALSPISQLALINIIKEASNTGSQFIIATHSPILMAQPGAAILNCDISPPQPIEYDEVEHVIFYREFLKDPQNYLHRI